MRTTSLLRLLANRTARPTASPAPAVAGAPRTLAPGAAWSITAAAPTIRVVRGIAWVTVEGDATDHVLHPGDTFTAPRDARRIAVQALTALEFTATTPARADVLPTRSAAPANPSAGPRPPAIRAAPLRSPPSKKLTPAAPRP